MHSAVILGGGIGGLACAVALRQRGYACMVYERAPELKEIGAGLLLTPNACVVLDKLGLLPVLKPHALVTPAWDVLDVNGRLLQQVRPHAQGQAALSTRRSDLQQVLLAALPADMVQLGHEAVDVQVKADRVKVGFLNGRQIEAPFLIAADGAASVVRQAVWPARVLQDQGYVGWRAVVDGVPAGWDGGRVTESWGRGQRFGIAPVGGGRTYWYATANRVAANAEGGEERALLLKLFQGWHEPVGSLIRSTPPEGILRHVIADARPEWTWTRGGRLALLGDAAHPLTPNLGQGAAMALEDAWEVARCLSERSTVPEALRLYEGRRRRRLMVVWAASRIVGKVIQVEDRRLAGLRDIALRATPARLASATLRKLYAFETG